MIHVDAEHRGKQVADVLAGVERVRRIGRSRIARRNVKETVRAELEAAAIMPAGEPGDDDFFARGIHLRRVGLCHLETRHVRAVGHAVFQHVAQIDKPVGR